MEYQYWNSNYLNSISEDSLDDVDWNTETYKGYMYARLQQMFKYKNLPDTIPHEMLEYYLLSGGVCFITEVDNNLYAFQGSLGGEPDPYYRPTKFIIANPALNFNKVCDVKKDGILMRNDRMWLGLDKLVTRYAHLMATNLITIKVVDIVLRCIALLSAPDDATKKSAEIFLDDLKKGKLGVIGENTFFSEGIRMQSPPANNGSYLTQFIELHQYYKGSFYNEIGLNANFNMKREAIGKGEASLSQDSLLPLCDTMLACRKEDVKRINEMFGTNIEVEFDSAWASNREESEYELEKLKKEASQLEGGEDKLDESNGEKTESGEGNIGNDDITSDSSSGGSVGNECKTEEETESASEDSGCGEEQEPDCNTGNEEIGVEENSDETDETVNQEVVVNVTVGSQVKEDKYDSEENEDSTDKGCHESS